MDVSEARGLSQLRLLSISGANLLFLVIFFLFGSDRVSDLKKSCNLMFLRLNCILCEAVRLISLDLLKENEGFLLQEKEESCLMESL